MKKIFVFSIFAVYLTSASAQDYAGALIAFTKFNGGCDASCGSKPLGMKFFAGTRLPDSAAIQMGFGTIDTVEVGVVKFGTRNSRGITQVYDRDNDVFVDAPQSKKLNSDGIYIVAGAHVPIVDRLSFTPKLGLAYVTTSLKTSINGSSTSDVSENHFAPYGGLGLEYAGPYDIKVSATIDWTRSKTKGVSAVSSLVGIGAAVGF